MKTKQEPTQYSKMMMDQYKDAPVYVNGPYSWVRPMSDEDLISYAQAYLRYLKARVSCNLSLWGW